MAHFTDKDGKLWSFDLTFGALERVNQHVLTSDGKPFDLVRMSEKMELGELAMDGRKFLEICFWVLRPEIQQRSGASDDQKAWDYFADLITGAAIRQMRDIFTQAFLDFIPSRQFADAIRMDMAAMDALMETALRKASGEPSSGSEAKG